MRVEQESILSPPVLGSIFTSIPPRLHFQGYLLLPVLEPFGSAGV